LKSEDDTWESAFLIYMQNVSQRDKDVTAGCQYYYESKNVIVDRDRDEATFEDMNEIDNDQLRINEEVQDETMDVSVSILLSILCFSRLK
jgi:hypothetical protein